MFMGLPLEIEPVWMYREHLGPVSDSPHHSIFHPSEIACKTEQWSLYQKLPDSSRRKQAIIPST